jgi:hypothetical protein
MINNMNSKRPIQAVVALVGILALVLVVFIAFGPEMRPMILRSTLTAIPPTSSPSSGYQPEVIPPPTYTQSPTMTATNVPTNAPVPTRTLIGIPTLVSDSRLLPLPDLTVTGISDPACAPEFGRTTLRFTIIVRNIGRAGTLYFGAFDVGVFIILGQQRYGLDEWKTKFDGVVGTSNLKVFNLKPDQDVKFTVVLDLKRNAKFGIEAMANSGGNPIREADMTNNTLIKYYSVYCY